MTRAPTAEPAIAFVITLLLASCAGAPDQTAANRTAANHEAPPAAASHAKGKGKAPLPYSAEQIRAAHPDGTLLRFRLVQPTVELRQCMRFENGDGTGVDVVTWSETPEGNSISAPAMQRAKWRDLRDHAAFAADQTTRSRARCQVPAGNFDCALYTVKASGGAGPIQRYYFADTKPGPPVLLVTEANGAEVMRMELLEYRRGS